MEEVTASLEAQEAWRPHEALARLRHRMEASYRVPMELDELGGDMRELLEFARAAANLLAQVQGWVQAYHEGDCDDDFALEEIAALTADWR